MKRPPLQLTAGEYAIKLSALKLWLKDDLEKNMFRIRLVNNSLLPFSSSGRKTQQLIPGA